MADFSNIQYHVFEDYDIPFDERGSSVGTVRKVQWVKIGVEPDPEKAKIEIRHITMSEEGERPMKGYSFSTPEGPSELVHGLIKVGFGDTKEILREVRKRDDFLEAAKTINEDPDEGDGEVFDMRDLLIGLDKEEDDVA
jgi:hypothetical protein